MFERFSDRARRAIVQAQEEARLLNHDYIGTEHILLGLIAERAGVAAQALGSLNVTLEAAREQVREIIGQGSQERGQRGHIPFTPRAKKVLELSLREALSLRSEIISTEHLLLGLIAEGDGVGAQILERLGVPAETVRARVLDLARTEPEPETDPAGGPATEPAGGPATEPATGPIAAPLSAWQTRPVRVRMESLSEVRDLLKSIDQRLTAIEGHLSGIERHLGIAPGITPQAESASPASADPPPGESPSAAAE
jgi:ATP-dependent Clp protease ATP-binding subunit ClpC